MNQSSICPNCGFPLQGNETFCPECGLDFRTVPAPEPKQEQPQPRPDAGNGSTVSNGPTQPAQPVHSVSLQSGDAVPVYYKFEKTDFAQYIYECSVIAWRSYTKSMFRFSGRASRREYWSAQFLFPLISQLFALPACLLMFLLMLADLEEIASVLILLAAIAFVVLPLLAIQVRRMHDIGSSGWWSIVPIVVLFKALKRSDPYENLYGAPEPCNLDEE